MGTPVKLTVNSRVANKLKYENLFKLAGTQNQEKGKHLFPQKPELPQNKNTKKARTRRKDGPNNK